MAAGLNPVTLQKRCRCHGGAGDDVRFSHGLLQILDSPHASGLATLRGGELVGVCGPAAPDRDVLQAGKDLPVGLDQRGGDHARSQNQQPSGVGPRQQPGAQHRIAGRFPLSHQRAVDQRLHRTVGIVEQDHDALYRGQRRVAFDVAGEDGHRLERQADSVQPRGPCQAGIGAALQQQVADLRLGGAVSRLDGVSDGGPGQPIFHGSGVDKGNLHGAPVSRGGARRKNLFRQGLLQHCQGSYTLCLPGNRLWR